MLLFGSMDVLDKIEINPKVFYRVIESYFKNEKEAIIYIRKEFGVGLMDSKKTLYRLKEKFTDERLKEMQENIETYSPELLI